MTGKGSGFRFFRASNTYLIYSKSMNNNGLTWTSFSDNPQLKTKTMKTIELKNQQDWFIILDAEHEKIQYIFTDEIYSKLESIIVEADFALDYP